MRNVALLDICDRKTGEDIIKLAYSEQQASLTNVLKDVSENGIIGDKIKIEFQLDTMNHERIRNFLSIMQLYNYAFKRKS